MEEREEYTPRKLTIRERLREQAVWIMFIIVFGFIIIWSTYVLCYELNYYFNGEHIDAVVNKKTSMAEFIKDDEFYEINISQMAYSSHNGHVTVYYFPGREKEGILLTTWKWWVMVYGMALFFVGWSIRSLYGEFRKKRIIVQKFSYEKKQVSGEELGRILTEDFVRHNKDLYEKHIENLKAETISYKKQYATFEALARNIIAEQEKIWKVGTVYLGILEDNNAVCRVAYTDNKRLLKNPDEFLKLLDSGFDNISSSDVHVMYTIVEKDKLPRDDMRYVLVVAKPGLCEYAVLLPAWYYFKEEIEVL